MQQKKIPLNYTCDAKNVLSDFAPTETLCYFCNVSLNTAVRISKVGRLLTMDAMVTVCKFIKNHVQIAKSVTDIKNIQMTFITSVTHF